MPIYSHSQLSMYEECPLKYKLRYRDKIRRETEGIEGFLGLRVHDTLKKCYDDLRFTRINSLSDLLAYYNKVWRENWNDSIIIMRQELTQEHYRAIVEDLDAIPIIDLNLRGQKGKPNRFEDIADEYGRPHCAWGPMEFESYNAREKRLRYRCPLALGWISVPLQSRT